MMTRIAVILTLAFFASLAAHADQGTRDGTWWRSLSPLQKNAYVVGFLDGTDYGTQNAASLVLGHLTGRTLPSDGREEAEAQAFMEWAKGLYYEIHKSTFLDRVKAGQLVDGVDHIYSDYRNRRIPPVLIIDVAAEAIRGSSDAEIERRLEGLRKMVSK